MWSTNALCLGLRDLRKRAGQGCIRLTSDPSSLDQHKQKQGNKRCMGSPAQLSPIAGLHSRYERRNDSFPPPKLKRPGKIRGKISHIQTQYPYTLPEFGPLYRKDGRQADFHILRSSISATHVEGDPTTGFSSQSCCKNLEDDTEQQGNHKFVNPVQTHPAYRPLPHNRCIRLLRVVPTSATDGNHHWTVALEVADRDGHRPFTALSYVWGPR